MNTKVLLAALAGGVANFLGGWLIYGILLDPFMRKGMSENVLALTRDTPEMWALALGCLVYGFFLAWLYSRWANISTMRTGAIAGAVIGMLIALNVNLMMYSMWNYFELSSIVLDVLAAAVLAGMTGGVVGWALGYKSNS